MRTRKTANQHHLLRMPELIARANQVILEAQWLRREGRSLRFEAAALASELGATLVRSRAAEGKSFDLRTSLEQAPSES